MASDIPQVLFVCVHNAGRSQMAAALLDRYAEGRVRVRSAGSTPANEINPCGYDAGCVFARCAEGFGCTDACHPVTGSMCRTTCDSEGPPCPEGETPEADGDCWTGFCIPSDVCG